VAFLLLKLGYGGLKGAKPLLQDCWAVYGKTYPCPLLFFLL